MPSIADFSTLTCCFVVICLVNVNSECIGVGCKKFECKSDTYVIRPVDPYLRTGSTFTSPCACAADWSNTFCNSTVAVVTSAVPPEPLPTVCICRKFSDYGSKCDQFISRCYTKKNNECACCFNQPSAYCNHLRCKHGEPDFGGANTTCVCYHNPADYPYQICKHLYTRDSAIIPRKAVLSRVNEQRTSAVTEHISLFGTKVAVSTVSYVILVLLVVVSILTLGMLLAGGRRLRRRRVHRLRQSRIARETLLMQRADDDRYLPAA